MQNEDVEAALMHEKAALNVGDKQRIEDSKKQIELVTRCLQGDECAFASIVDLYGNLLLRTAYLLVRDEDTAKDIVQEALILAWKHMDKLREPLFLRAWLLKIVVNQAMSFKRQLARKTTFLHEQFAQHTINNAIQETDFQQGRVEENLDIVQGINRLPLNQRVVLIFYYYHRMTIPEIAEILGVAENTLRKRLQAALTKLRRVLNVESAPNQASAITPENIQQHLGLHKGEA